MGFEVQVVIFAMITVNWEIGPALHNDDVDVDDDMNAHFAVVDDEANCRAIVKCLGRIQDNKNNISISKCCTTTTTMKTVARAMVTTNVQKKFKIKRIGRCMYIVFKSIALNELNWKWKKKKKMNVTCWSIGIHQPVPDKRVPNKLTFEYSMLVARHVQSRMDRLDIYVELHAMCAVGIYIVYNYFTYLHSN